MKYKVGDRVKVREDLKANETYGHDYYFSPEMADYKGRIVTISRVGDDFYKIEGDTHYWFWTDEMFEEIKMKYKVGDKVRVKRDLVINEKYGDGTLFRNDMARYEGQVVTISEIGDYSYRIKEDNERWGWTDEMFEDVAEAPTDGKIQTVDVGYYLAFCGHRLLMDVYQDGTHDGKAIFTSADGFNRYILPNDAIQWVVPHEREIDL